MAHFIKIGNYIVRKVDDVCEVEESTLNPLLIYYESMQFVQIDKSIIIKNLLEICKFLDVI